MRADAFGEAELPSTGPALRIRRRASPICHPLQYRPAATIRATRQYHRGFPIFKSTACLTVVVLGFASLASRGKLGSLARSHGKWDGPQSDAPDRVEPDQKRQMEGRSSRQRTFVADHLG